MGRCPDFSSGCVAANVCIPDIRLCGGWLFKIDDQAAGQSEQMSGICTTKNKQTNPKRSDFTEVLILGNPPQIGARSVVGFMCLPIVTNVSHE